MSTRIDQCLPDFAKHDAIGNHVLRVRDALRGAGYDSDIWADRIDERLGGEARPYQEFPHGTDAVLVYHLSTDSDMAAWLEARADAGGAVVASYHNITPARFFRRWEPDVARRLDVAREQMKALGPKTSFALAHSSYNRLELDESGYASTAVSPLLVDLEGLRDASNPRTFQKLSDAKSRGGARWLFVGRIAPNKCQHDVVAAFAVYRRLFDPAARLTLVGSPSSYRYLSALRRLVTQLDLDAHVEHLDNISHGDLVAHYLAADVLVCMSEHEGFCVPLIEAMELGLPVVAFAAAAVPETVAGAGELVEDKDPLAVALTVDSLLRDATRREELVAAGRARAGELALGATSKRLLDLLAGWLDARESPRK